MDMNKEIKASINAQADAIQESRAISESPSVAGYADIIKEAKASERKLTSKVKGLYAS